jgi:hypothetical protein
MQACAKRMDEQFVPESPCAPKTDGDHCAAKLRKARQGVKVRGRPTRTHERV